MQQRYTSVTLLILCLTGCGGPATFPVSGVVQFKDGTPLPGGSIELQAIAAPGTPIFADVDEQGRFALAAPSTGEFKAIVLARDAGFNGFEAAPPLIDSRFRAYETSGLTVTIKDSGNQVTLEVDRPR